ncbi:HlyD family secretion protein [Synechococcus sp. RSCCF101]|uniref:HlyD family secretion protein n=1 Tax=Synechococcus sp. RSCCF101 TaxID=2511069 RepID=UPI0012477EB1|nr:HlyD family secretion protein [Synechococcus sp. RSCCF101]QEY31000.1 HlyD family secretion protein [Synechococcus sp. RSCCF101]
MTDRPLIKRYGPTAAVVLVAAGLAVWKLHQWVVNPWTRDGQVRANVIEIAPRVSGPIVELPIRDNQEVAEGDLLFRIDPRTFQVALDKAAAELDDTRVELTTLARQVEVERASVVQARSVIQQKESTLKAAQVQLREDQKNYDRGKALIASGSITQRDFDDDETNFVVSQSNVDEAEAALLEAKKELLQKQASLQEAIAKQGAPGDKNAQLRSAQSAVRDAELNLEFTEVRAPVDGYVTNLNLRLGRQTVANQPALALVDKNSFWVDAYIRETWIRRVNAGDDAVVTLMSHPNQPLDGTVDSLGWGIFQQTGSTGQNLLPNVEATFEWIRLAQRIPVKVTIDEVPDSIALRLGSTASVLIRANSSNSN